MKDFIKEYEEDVYSFWENIDSECQLYYAYLLFKDGVSSKRGSLVGSLQIMTNTELDTERDEIQKIITKYNLNN